MEGENKTNSYVYGSTEFIDPNSIIAKVNVKKITEPSRKVLAAPGGEEEPNMNQSFYEIVEEDLKTVSELLKKAITDGGIEHEIEEEEEVLSDSSESSKARKSAVEALDNKDFYDKEDSNEPDEMKKESAKVPASKKAAKGRHSSSGSGSSDSDEETLREPSIKKKVRTKSPPSKKPKSFLEYHKQIIKNKTEGAVKLKHVEADKKKAVASSGVSSNGNGDHSGTKSVEGLKKKDEVKPAAVVEVVKPFCKPVMKSHIEVRPIGRQEERPSKDKVEEKKKSEVTGLEKLKSAMKPPKVSVGGDGGIKKEKPSDNDTDQMDSDGEVVVKKAKKKQASSPKETINVKKMPVQENSNNNNVNNNNKINSSVVATEQGKGIILFIGKNFIL